MTINEENPVTFAALDFLSPVCLALSVLLSSSQSGACVRHAILC